MTFLVVLTLVVALAALACAVLALRTARSGVRREGPDALPEDEEITAADRLIIDSPTTTGLILMKALAAEPGLMPQAQASLQAATCAPQTDAPAKAEAPRARR